MPLRPLMFVAAAGLAALSVGLARANASSESGAAPGAKTLPATTISSVLPPPALPAAERSTDSAAGGGEPTTTTPRRVPDPVGPVIRIGVGDRPQALVDAAPEGATFLIESGVHLLFSVQPKSGQTFRAEPGAVLDGGDLMAHAFHAFGKRDLPADSVTIVGAAEDAKLVLRNYAGPLQTGAIHPHVDTRPNQGMGRDWLVQWCDVHDNRATGIRVADGMVVRGNAVHHNGQLGVGGKGDGVVIEGNEVAYNRTRNDVDPMWEGGGIKLAESDGTVVADNHVHHNRGPGIWFDIGAINTVVRANRVDANESAGIFDETSYGAVIRANIVTRNGTVDGGWFWNGGIQIAASSNVEIADNTLIDNRHGIMLIQQQRGEGRYGPHLIDNVTVRGNTIRNSGITGAVRDTDDFSLYDESITFADNTYDTEAERPFTWNDGFLDRDGWAALGHDGG